MISTTVNYGIQSLIFPKLMKTYLIPNCDVTWYCMWGTQLKANWLISWNFTYLLFFVPKQLQEVKKITFISASHLQLLHLLLLIILQHTLKSHVFYLFTSQLHATNKNRISNSKWHLITHLVKHNTNHTSCSIPTDTKSSKKKKKGKPTEPGKLTCSTGRK